MGGLVGSEESLDFYSTLDHEVLKSWYFFMRWKLSFINHYLTHHIMWS